MNIMVFDVPAESGGALSVLKDFYNEVIEHKSKDIQWIFVLSTLELKETENVKVLRFPWIKKSWFHRVYFDYVIAPSLVKKYFVDSVFSLQNVTIPNVKCRQVVYLHQALPFIDYKFSIQENRLLWVYQNIIGRKIISSLRNANHIIVQSRWLREACTKKAKINKSKVSVLPPKINLNINEYFKPSNESLTTFFYPASGLEYKNHQVIINACKLMEGFVDEDYRIYFTLKGNENKYIEDLYRQVQESNLPIYFVGELERNLVYKWYTKSILLFPSYIESFGLPILEARLHRGIIIAADTLFSKEILDGYINASFFNGSDAKELSIILTKYVQKKIEYKNLEQESRISQNKGIIDMLINY